MDKEQYYPTPVSLAVRMWEAFRDGSYLHRDRHILEPSAGTGDLVKAMPESRYGSNRPIVDVCEIDPERLEILGKTAGVSVVGHDFLAFEPSRLYTHIIMNPPFRLGTKHLIHAWHIVRNAEIVCLLNAETLRNPNTKDREYLQELIGAYGSVEYVDGAFLAPDTQRTTAVECALVWLKKETPVAHSYLDGLRLDNETFEFGEIRGDVTDLCLPENIIETAVRVYRAARDVLYRWSLMLFWPASMPAGQAFLVVPCWSRIRSAANGSCSNRQPVPSTAAACKTSSIRNMTS